MRKMMMGLAVAGLMMFAACGGKSKNTAAAPENKGGEMAAPTGGTGYGATGGMGYGGATANPCGGGEANPCGGGM
jgi:hypothetical protein